MSNITHYYSGFRRVPEFRKWALLFFCLQSQNTVQLQSMCEVCNDSFDHMIKMALADFLSFCGSV